MTFLFLFALLTTASADELLVPLDKGDEAPFDGVLFNNEALADLKVKLQFSQERCQLQIDEAIERQKISDGLDVEIAQIGQRSCEERASQLLTSKDQQLQASLELLRVTKEPKFKAAPFVAGTLTGVATAILTAYAYSQIEEHSN